MSHHNLLSSTGAAAPPALALIELAERLDGLLVANGVNPIIRGIASITEAGPDDITFLSDAKGQKKHIDELATSRAAAVIAPAGVAELPLPSIRFAQPYIGLSRALNFFHPAYQPPSGIHPTAFVDERASVHPTACIGPHAVVEAGADIGANVVLDGQVFVGRGAVIGVSTHFHPQVKLLHGCRVGARSIVHSGAVIGSDGFGFTRVAEGHVKIPQIGIVEIGDDVEIGANVTIDRAAMGKTFIGNGTKIDNLVHIAHNCVIGRNCLIIAQVGISGSTIIEDGVTLAGQSGTVGHVRIGRGAVVAARGVVTEDVASGAVVSGFPLKPHTEEKRIMAALRRLPDLVKTVRDLERRLDGEIKATSEPGDS
ncbi:MAG: UDP-3-O-(3-hydroxymyristoyl)glucosamine N-acyltransferase [Candidatus Riflebacteria bacterium]|nr:UDP-3-O-(3-hydroxymyristoyl)glucosamine N-acyltransferase [Candidatus Riflebacteria bacterium]